MSKVKNLLSGRLRPIVGLVTFAAIGLVAMISLVARDDGTVADETDFLQRYRVIENVEITGVVPDSQVNYTIESIRLLQFPERGISDMTEPRVTQIDAEGYKRVLEADTGRYYEVDQEVSLKGNVSIALTNPDQSNTMASTTDELTFKLGDLRN